MNRIRRTVAVGGTPPASARLRRYAAAERRRSLPLQAYFDVQPIAVKYTHDEGLRVGTNAHLEKIRPQGVKDHGAVRHAAGGQQDGLAIAPKGRQEAQRQAAVA